MDQAFEELMKESGGIYLKEKLGVNEWAFKREDALKILEVMKERKILCSGGDVIVESDDGKLKYTHDNWYYQNTEDDNKPEQRIGHSIAKAENYIKSYPEESGKNFYYVLT